MGLPAAHGKVQNLDLGGPHPLSVIDRHLECKAHKDAKEWVLLQCNNLEDAHLPFGQAT